MADSPVVVGVSGSGLTGESERFGGGNAVKEGKACEGDAGEYREESAGVMTVTF